MNVKVVLDTNVLVSSLLSVYGTPAKIVEKVFDNDLILVCYFPILTEYYEVLHRDRFSFNALKVKSILDFLEENAEMVNPLKCTIPMPDEDDKIFLETAIYAKAILITGNKRHFPEADFIQTPAEFIVEQGWNR